MDLEKFLKGLDLENVKSTKDIAKHINAQLKEHKTKILLDSTEEPTYIPKYRLDNEIEKRKNAEKTILDLEKEIESNKEAVGKIEEFKAEKEKLETKIKNIEKSRLIEKEVLKLNQQPYDVKDLVENYLDMEKVVVKDGEISGVKEQLDNLVKEKSYLFKPVEGGSNGPGQPKGDKGLEGEEDSLGDKLAKDLFTDHDDIVKAQNDFFN